MKKRVLLIHNFYQIGGGEHTVFENEHNLLLKNGHEVFVYSRDNDELKHSVWKLLCLPFTTTWSFKTYFEVRNTIKRQGIDIVHCHNTFPLISPSVYYAARSLKVPVVQTIHNFRFLCPNGLFFCDGAICEQCRESGSFVPAVKKSCYRGSSLQTAVVAVMLRIHRILGTYRKINYIFLTDFNKQKFDKLIDVYGNNVFVKPNFIPENGLCVQSKPEKPIFVYAGRLDKNKGIDFLLEAWKKMPGEYELHIFGDGAYKQECEVAASEQKNIRFLGFRPQKEVLEVLSNASVLVYPSVWYETFGMSWAESFSLGRPALVPALGNHGEFVTQSQGGLTYESGNIDAFCRAAKKLIENWETYSNNAWQFFEKNLRADSNYEKLSGIYDEVKHIR